MTLNKYSNDLVETESLPTRPVGYLLRFCIFVLLAIFVCPTIGQNVKSSNSNSLDARQQNGLVGNVRRVRVEIAKIATKEGKQVEGPRVLKEVTTYDLRGARIDSVTQPVDVGEVAGKREYRYDSQGNPIEMMVRSEDGALLSKESYGYVFDQFGNWVKMTTSVAVYEEGKVSFEPTEITYRTITYFYNQNVANLTDNKQAPASSSVKKEIVNLPQPTKSVNSAASFLSTLTPAPSQPANSSTMPAQIKVDETPPQGNDNSVTSESLTASTSTPAPPPVTKKVSAKRVSEAVLRTTIVTLPPPEFPMVAELSGRNQKVEVQVVIDEKGNVISAKGTSSLEILNEAAEVAAKKAKFAINKFTDNPGQIFSVITYDFIAVPTSQQTASVTKASARDPNKPRTNAGALLPTPDDVRKAEYAGDSSTGGYQRGVSLLNEGRFSEAASSLKAFVYKNPDDAMGYAKLGEAYVALRKNEEAVIALKMAIQIRPSQTNAQTYYLLGTSYNALGKYSEGLTALNKANSLVGQESKEQNAGEARGQINPFMIHYSLGVAYFGLTKTREAMKEFEKAIALDPKGADAYYALALAQLSLGEQKSAQKQLEILQSLNPALAKKLSNIIAGRAMLLPQGCRTFPCP